VSRPPAADPFADAAALEGVASSYAGARDGIDAVLRDRGLRRTTPEDTARSLLLGAVASAALDGSAVTADELAEGGGDERARAALRLSSQLLGVLPTWDRAPLQALARMHALAAAGTVPDDQLGRPVDPAGAARLAAIAERVRRPTTAPGLVVAALVHADIATSGAFGDLTGTIARATERLVLVSKGVDPASVMVPEAGHAADQPAYRASLQAYAEGDLTGTHRWLLYAAEAFTRAIELSPIR
jgi:hypothetical protein